MELSFRKILIHTGLFLFTFICTTIAGAEWVYGKSIFAVSVVDNVPEIGFNHSYSWQDFSNGMLFSVPFLLILTVHEFGHYFTAIYNKVRTNLPYYLPFPPNPFVPGIGTFGAVIRLKDRVYSRQQNFDIGIAGPLAGFVIAFGLLWYAFATLPPPEYIYQFHPDYQKYGLDYANFVYAPSAANGGIDMILGRNLLFIFFENVVADPSRVPNVHEIMHYPFLFAGFLSLVFTSINLLPIGQLDGGHVVYGLLGFRGHRIVASVVFISFIFYAGLGVLAPGKSWDVFSTVEAGSLPQSIGILLFIGFVYVCLGGLKWSWQNQLMTAVIIVTIQYFLAMFFPGIQGYSGWLLFALIIGRVLGVIHPPSEIEEPLTRGRKILGWIALAVFILCFTPAPIDIIVNTPAAP